MKTQIIDEDEIRQHVALDHDVIEVVKNAFVALSGDDVVMPEILNLAIEEHNGEVDVKTAYISGLDTFTIKISPGFFNNAKLGLPSVNGLMVVFDSKTGLVKSILLDNGYLTNIRTAAAGALAARYLAPETINTAAVIGSGVQARLQIQALTLERSFERLMIYSRNRDQAQQYKQQMQQTLGCQIDIAQSIEQCVRQSQVVITTTPSTEPLIQSQWLHANLHITAMGADAPHKCELDPLIYNKADRFVVDNKAQSLAQGELRCVLNQGLIDATTPIQELGELCSGLVEKRKTNDAITVCDLTGTGVQDTAIADYTWNLIKHNPHTNTFNNL